MLCTKCNRDLPDTEFNQHNGKWCRECKNAYMRDYYKRRRKEDKNFAKCQDEISRNARCKSILRKHHEMMADDPERLTTEFLVKLTGCSCKRHGDKNEDIIVVRE